jgi:hypothetical protein
LHHDNAPAHDTLTIWEFLAKKIYKKIGISIILATFGPGYSQKGHAFSDTLDTHAHATTTLQSIPKERFQGCFEQWKH